MPDLGSAAHLERHTGWSDVLTTMERDLDASGGMLDHATHAMWTLPLDLGDLPGELRSRAEMLLGSHQRAIEALEQRMQLTGRHLAALKSIPARVAPSGTAAYLDITG